MRAEKGRAGSHHWNFSGYIRRPLSMPGVYESTAARMVSKTRIKHFEQIIPLGASWFFLPVTPVFQLL